MHIRLIGAPDLMRAWAAELKRAYGIECREYPSRRGGPELRIYAELDDRLAAQIVGLAPPAAPSQPPTLPTDRRPRRRKEQP